MPQALLNTRRLSLRPLERGDKEMLYELDVHPEVMRYIFTGKPLTDEEAAMSFNHLYTIAQNDPGLGCWVGHDKENNFVGWWVIATPPHPEENPAEGEDGGDAIKAARYDSQRVEIGMRIAPKYWGQGFAKEGLQALLKHCFEDLNKTEVYGETMTINAGCRALMERCGMIHIRTWHNNYEQFTPAPGIEEGEVEHRITREEWISGPRTVNCSMKQE